MEAVPWWLATRLLLVLAAANTTPLLAKRWLGPRCAWPLDGGLRFVDGRPLLGPSKTWRGLASAVLAAAATASLLGLPAAAGAAMGALAMAGDALASFVKRRLGLAPSARATGLDQIPEALLPLLGVHSWLGLPLALITALTLVFFLLEMPLARWWFRAGWRDQPY